MDISKISIGKNAPEEVNVIIEVPMGGDPIKYEFDKDAGAIIVDRFLHTPMRYPANYGFIPHTLSDDGDPADVLVVSEYALIPGCVVACRPVGVLKMEDDGGMDEKIIAVPVTKLNPTYKNVECCHDLPEHLIAQIQHFFEHYKDLEPGKWVKILGWGKADEAKSLIEAAINGAQKAA